LEKVLSSAENLGGWTCLKEFLAFFKLLGALAWLETLALLGKLDHFFELS
jgi:hypothetical protein